NSYSRWLRRHSLLRETPVSILVERANLASARQSFNAAIRSAYFCSIFCWLSLSCGSGPERNSSLSSVPVNENGERYGPTGLAVSSPTSKVSSNEYARGTVCSSRASPSFLPLTVSVTVAPFRARRRRRRSAAQSPTVLPAACPAT